jgi:hypothetical protein
LLALPHPKRVDIAGLLDAANDFIHDFAPACHALGKIPTASRINFVSKMVDRYPAIAKMFVGPGVARSEFGFDTEPLEDMALRLYWRQRAGRTFQITDALDERLAQTTIGADIPADWFRLPHSCVYIQFGTRPSTRLPTLYHGESGEHRIEGCYLLEYTNSYLSHETAAINNLDPNIPVRAIEMIVCGSAEGKAHILDDVVTHTHIVIRDENKSIVDTLKYWLEYADRLAGQRDRNWTVLPTILEHVAKVLVYLGTAECRRRQLNEESTARQELASIKSGSKLAKAERKLRRLYDRIVVGPDSFPVASPVIPGSSGAMPMHWRRGHFRSQPYGPNLSLRRPKWIEPMLIRADLLSAEQVPVTKDYLVK